MNYDSKVDAYIADAADFARPILTHWRQIIHKNCPDVTEAMKWGFFYVEYKGDNLCVLASYKKHCSYTFL